jgi:hypothetical protein
MPVLRNHKYSDRRSWTLILKGDILTTTKYFQLEYDKISNHQSNRIAKNKVKSIGYVIDNMLKDYPKAKEIAYLDLNLAKTKKT